MDSVIVEGKLSAVGATKTMGQLSRGIIVADKVESDWRQAGEGKPIMLRMDVIDEDPQQPRSKDNPGFSSQSLTELAAAITLRGVKTPISVRPNPARGGHFLINHGARRFRASRIAGLEYIPGFIDENYEQADQIVENLHRNELTAREIADYIGRELAKGLRKGDIAKQISKSAAFVTQHVTLLDLPDAIAAAFNSARIRDVTLINELVKVYRNAPSEVGSWLSDEHQEVSRSSVKMLRDFISSKAVQADEAGPASCTAPLLILGKSDGADMGVRDEMKGQSWQSPVLYVRHAAREARLLIRRRPSTHSRAWIRYTDDYAVIEVALKDLQLTVLLDDSEISKP